MDAQCSHHHQKPRAPVLDLSSIVQVDTQNSLISSQAPIPTNRSASQAATPSSAPPLAPSPLDRDLFLRQHILRTIVNSTEVVDYVDGGVLADSSRRGSLNMTTANGCGVERGGEMAAMVMQEGNGRRGASESQRIERESRWEDRGVRMQSTEDG